MAIDPSQIELTPEQRIRLALLVDKTGKECSDVVNDLLNAAPLSLQQHSGSRSKGETFSKKSLYDVLSERGILGCFDGPTDLSTNPKHMEGFGESHQPTNSG